MPFTGTNALRYYTGHLVVLHVNPYRLVYVSSKLLLHDTAFRPARMQRYWDIEDDFLFPVGLIIEDPDSLVISAHLNDATSVLLRLTGVGRLMDKVIALDRKSAPEKGPPIGTINRKVKEMMERQTKVHFV